MRWCSGLKTPDELLKDVSLSDSDKAIVEDLVSRHPEIADLHESLCRLLPELDEVLITVLLVDNPGLKITEHRLLLYGLIIRAKGLLRATLRETIRDNKPAVTTLLRAQCEILAAVCYVEKFPDKVRNILSGTKRKGNKLEAPNILTQVGHANRKYRGLARDYDQLSNLSHPTPISHTGSVRIVDEKKRQIEFATEPFLRPGEAETAVRLIHAWTNWFLETAIQVHEVFTK